MSATQTHEQKRIEKEMAAISNSRRPGQATRCGFDHRPELSNSYLRSTEKRLATSGGGLAAFRIIERPSPGEAPTAGTSWAIWPCGAVVGGLLNAASPHVRPRAARRSHPRGPTKSGSSSASTSSPSIPSAARRANISTPPPSSSPRNLQSGFSRPSAPCAARSPPGSRTSRAPTWSPSSPHVGRRQVHHHVNLAKVLAMDGPACFIVYADNAPPHHNANFRVQDPDGSVFSAKPNQ